jgi:hypothetical protein
MLRRLFTILALAAVLFVPTTTAFATAVAAGPTPVAPAATDAKPTIKVVVVGDSYTSGEGASPGTYRVVPVPGGANGEQLYSVDPAHQSSTAPTLQALNQIQAANPGANIDVTFVPISGAVRDSLYQTTRPGTPFEHPPQIDAVRGADVVIVGIGGNDARFTQWIGTVLSSTESTSTQAFPQFMATFNDGSYLNRQVSLLNNISALAGPDATIVSLGYPKAMPAQIPGSMTWWSPFSWSTISQGEADLSNQLAAALNTANEQASFIAGGQHPAQQYLYADVSNALQGNELFTNQEGLHGVDASNVNGSYHPNDLGQRLLATVLLPYVVHAVNDQLAKRGVQGVEDVEPMTPTFAYRWNLRVQLPFQLATPKAPTPDQPAPDQPAPDQPGSDQSQPPAQQDKPAPPVDGPQPADKPAADQPADTPGQGNGGQPDTGTPGANDQPATPAQPDATAPDATAPNGTAPANTSPSTAPDGATPAGNQPAQAPAQPDAGQPAGADQPAATPPDASQPAGTDQSATAPPGAAQPAATPADGSQPAAAPADGSQPAAAPPVGSQPGAASPDGSPPAAAPPDAGQPAATPPDGSQPAATPPDGSQPAAAPPDAGQPAATPPAAPVGADQPASANQPAVADQPAAPPAAAAPAPAAEPAPAVDPAPAAAPAPVVEPAPAAAPAPVVDPAPVIAPPPVIVDTAPIEAVPPPAPIPPPVIAPVPVPDPASVQTNPVDTSTGSTGSTGGIGTDASPSSDNGLTDIGPATGGEGGDGGGGE